MALFKDSHEITGIRVGNKIITSIHKNGMIIWQWIKSCFGKGFWINDKIWSNTDAWKN